jgi:hypothetical protein
MHHSTPNGPILRDGLDRFFNGHLNPIQVAHWFLKTRIEPFPEETSDEGCLRKGTLKLPALFAAPVSIFPSAHKIG